MSNEQKSSEPQKLTPTELKQLLLAAWYERIALLMRLDVWLKRNKTVNVMSVREKLYANASTILSLESNLHGETSAKFHFIPCHYPLFLRMLLNGR